MVFPALCYQPKIDFPGLFLQPLAVVANPCGFVNGLTRRMLKQCRVFFADYAEYAGCD
ncbi:TPA: hypothetical protein RG728_001878 [Morganella morganii subsp. morganii]|uniref:hypothetical protein n=1 Tax=Morganella morganii TaxID=582 RepID=UPI00131F1AC4|nr:hypothetical protein [Morganella morganii]EKW8484947.1 hypothetical protein [Morganella morganii]HAT3623609.1 hypothetical protein [Morganella morganii]HCU0878990.1 hypothetical protein [Morganella morganii]HDU8692774.1 hypothetical protein [Morganella morganii subsp. morganii]